MNPIKHFDPLGLFCVPLPSKKGSWEEYAKSKHKEVYFNGAFFHTVGGAVGVCKFTLLATVLEKRTIQERELCFECTNPQDCAMLKCEFNIKEGKEEKESRSREVEAGTRNSIAIRIDTSGYANSGGDWGMCTNPYTGERHSGSVR